MTWPLRFFKLQSIGNDFPLVHLQDVRKLASHDVDPLLEKLAIAICDRKFGIGGDGFLTLEQTPSSDLLLRMFNPDGTEDFCGNGLRCAAVHAVSQGWVGESFSIEHLGRTVHVTISGETVRTLLGTASYAPAAVPLARGLGEIYQGPIYWSGGHKILGSALTTGSTHVVVPVSELPTDEKVLEIGPKIENFEIYPQRTSIIWSKEVEPDHLKIRIWERGVGETLGCGTGSSAAVADYLRAKGSGGRVRVDNPGGTVYVEMESWDGQISVEGEARAVFEGEFLFGA